MKMKIKCLIIGAILAVLAVVLIWDYREKQLVTQIKNGVFYNIKESDIVDIKEIEDTYKNIAQDTEWVYMDINDDGVKDLIWQEKKERIIDKEIIGIFDISQNGKCVFWDTIDKTEYYFVTDNGNLVYYSQYFGVYCYISYKLCDYNRKWNQIVEREICAYYINDIDNTLYWMGIDEHDHSDMIENGVYFKLICKDIETAISKDEFAKEFEKIIQSDYSILKYKSDLFWLYK